MKDQAFVPSGPVSRRNSGRPALAGDDVVDFASRVVALIAARKSAAEPKLRPGLLAAFRAAVIDGDPARVDGFLRDLVRQKVPATALADLYIPALARQIGDDWLEDRASFLEVTLVTSRLQAMLRAIGMAWVADTGNPATDSSILLVVPPREQHTLGAMVLMGRLRRIGISVRLAIAPAPAELRRILAGSSFSGVLLSVVGTDRLVEMPALVADIRAAGPAGLPVVIGGQVTGSGSAGLLRTGADAVVSDLSEALAVCGLQRDGNRALRRA